MTAQDVRNCIKDRKPFTCLQVRAYLDSPWYRLFTDDILAYSINLDTGAEWFSTRITPAYKQLIKEATMEEQTEVTNDTETTILPTQKVSLDKLRTTLSGQQKRLTNR